MESVWGTMGMTIHRNFDENRNYLNLLKFTKIYLNMSNEKWSMRFLKPKTYPSDP